MILCQKLPVTDRQPRHSIRIASTRALSPVLSVVAGFSSFHAVSFPRISAVVSLSADIQQDVTPPAFPLFPTRWYTSYRPLSVLHPSAPTACGHAHHGSCCGHEPSVRIRLQNTAEVCKMAMRVDTFFLRKSLWTVAEIISESINKIRCTGITTLFGNFID